MDWLSDNHVWLSAAIVGFIILVALVVLVLRALRLWRAVKAAMRASTEAAELVTAEVDRMNAAVAALPDRQAEVQRAIADLQARVRMLGVLGAAATDFLSAVRWPLKNRF